MDEQRLERLLRAGPPFGTPYPDRPLVLRQPVIAPSAVSLRRMALLLAIVALLLAATIVGALLSGVFRETVVAIVMDDPGGARSYNVSVFYSSGREEAISLPIAGPFWIEDFAWSHDGQRLAFTAGERASRSESLALYVMRADGSDLRRITKPTPWQPCGWGTAGEPMQWSPSDDVIAFCIGQYDPDGLRTQLKVVDVATGEMIKLDNGTNEFFGPFKFSPDGLWLAYRRQTSGNELWAVPINRSESPILLSDLEEAPGEQAEQEVQGFAWSPGSDAVAYGDLSGGAGTIQIAWLDGRRSAVGISETMAEGAMANVLVWNRDDELIYLAAGGRVVTKVTSDGRALGALFTWGSASSPPWVASDGSIDWGKIPWVSSDGRTVQWWEHRGASDCLMTGVAGATHTGLCIADEEFVGGAPAHPMALSELR